jgi:hypothetical protein
MVRLQLSLDAGLAVAETRAGLKFSERWKWEELKHRLVLTPEEKRAVTFVVAAFILGLGTKCYRDAHPHQPVQMDKKHSHFRKAQP